MKKFLKVIGVLFLVFILFIAVVAYMAKSWEMPDENVAGVDLLTLEDGSYRGEYTAKPLHASVSVEVRDHRITNIVLEKHRSGKGRPAESIIQAILQEQKLDVDVISGATLSSYVIRNAVADALTQ